MKENTQLVLQPSVLWQLPFHNYVEDFTFIVNGNEYKTNKIISDLLSPIICQQHNIDPTMNCYTINTEQKGDFSYILNLSKFTPQMIPDEEIPFIAEVFKQLQNPSIKVLLPQSSPDFKIDNIFGYIQKHEKSQIFYSELFNLEIEFISKNFYEIVAKHKDELKKLEINTLYRILQNPQLQLNDENQLMSFINDLYFENPSYSILYETVIFSNVDQPYIDYFINIFDINDINSQIWRKISDRLKEKIEPNKNDVNQIEKKRYKSKNLVQQPNPQKKLFLYLYDQKFNGIINYLQKESNGKIQNLINISSSQLHSNSYSPYNVCIYDDSNKYFYTDNLPYSWICFDFKDHRIIPTSYIIKSGWHLQNGHHPKSWVVEGFSENNQWEKLDERVNCAYLNGLNVVHSFNITQKNSASYRHIRIRQTGKNWANSNCFVLGSVEFYGTLI